MLKSTCKQLGAIIAVSLAALAARAEETGGVQLWENGPYWAECNIGATTTEGYGDIFRFDAASNAVQEALGAPWRVPTDAELLALKDNCDSVWTNLNGVDGRLFMSKSNDKGIFLPAAGCLHGDRRDDIGVRGCYWSCVAVDYDTNYVYYLSVPSGTITRNYTGRESAGASIRAVRDVEKVVVEDDEKAPGEEAPAEESSGGGEETVMVDGVTTDDPWSALTVNYTLSGLSASTEYKVAFELTAGDVTMGVTNAAAKLANGAASQVIDTAALFGNNVKTDTPMKVRVALIALQKLGGVQLWDGGPFWAECNIGATAPEEFGTTCTFADAPQQVSDTLGDPWRVPTQAEIIALANNCTYDLTAAGCTFTGKSNGKSVFFPADAKGKGKYWASEHLSWSTDWGYALQFAAPSTMSANGYATASAADFAVRAVRDNVEGVITEGEYVVDLVGYTGVNGLEEALLNRTNRVTSAPAQGGDHILEIENADGSTDYVHVFLSTDAATFKTDMELTARVMMIGGGGGGGNTGVVGTYGTCGGGGGGAGAVVERRDCQLAAGTYDIAIGAGGNGGSYWSGTGDGGAGGTSVLASGGETLLSAAGGGGGGSAKSTGSGGNGACGGGAGGHNASVGENFLGGTGNPGCDGGSSATVEKCRGAGGGGMATPGESSVGTMSGNGGNGVVSDILGWKTYFGGGGAGGTDTALAYGRGGLGGGASGSDVNKVGNAGTCGLGGGGAGASSCDGLDKTAGAGGSGAVIIRYTVAAGSVIPVEAPTAKTDLVYTGSEQVGVEAKTGWTLSGEFAATDAGDYTATATLEDGYAWSDGVQDQSRTIAWSIAKATPTFSGAIAMPDFNLGETAPEPSGLTVDFGEIVYRYYADAPCTQVIDQPTAAGTYFVRGEVAVSENWETAFSAVKAFNVIDPSVVDFTGTDGFVNALAADENLVTSAPAQGGNYILKFENDDGSTDYTHVFTTVGAATFTISDELTARVLVVGGGGGGGAPGVGNKYNDLGFPNVGMKGGGGGGAGAVVEGTDLQLAAGTYDITVGAGGNGGTPWTDGTGNGGNGSESMLGAGGETILSAAGGGGGGAGTARANGDGVAGGCGGGAAGHPAVDLTLAGGAGDPGGDGGTAAAGVDCSGSGGGGMGTPGESSLGTKSGDGGNGVLCDILGWKTHFGGGGAGGSIGKSADDYGKGGLGGGGDAVKGGSGNVGTTGLGGGGAGSSNASSYGAKGGSGAVIIRYTVAAGAVLPAEVPTAKTDLVYTGSEQVGVEAKTGWTLSGEFAATAVGDYVATATLADGYEWADGYEQAYRTIAWSIAKATPTFSGAIAMPNWNMDEAPFEPSGLTVDLGELVYKYYADAACTQTIDPPTDQSGVYYVRGEVAGSESWLAAASPVKAFLIIDPSVVNYTGADAFTNALAGSSRLVTEMPEDALAEGGDYILKIKSEYVHIFLNPAAAATFTARKRLKARVMVIGGGGGGGGIGNPTKGGGGGGAGAVVEVTDLEFAKGTYDITVGAGGIGGTPWTDRTGNGGNGGASSITSQLSDSSTSQLTLTAAGGGGGGSTGGNPRGTGNGGDGACGGGASGHDATSGMLIGGLGSVGGAGGSASGKVDCAGAGGGGVSSDGEWSAGTTSGDGGFGIVSDILGWKSYFGGGGAGGSVGGKSASDYGTGGFGGGGDAVQGDSGNAGTNGLGGGGAGASGYGVGYSGGYGGAGGNGIVIIRYKVRKGLIFVIK